MTSVDASKTPEKVRYYHTAKKTTLKLKCGDYVRIDDKRNNFS